MGEKLFENTHLQVEPHAGSNIEWFKWLLWIISIVWCTFQLWTARMPLPAFYQRSLHFLFNFIFVFLTVNLKGKDDRRFRWDAFLLSTLTAISLVYAYATWSTKAFIRGMELPIDEMILGWIFIFLTMEVCRRSVGWTLPIVTGLMILYGRFGESLPAVLAHRNYSFERMVMSSYISLDGIMGYLAHVSTTFIFIFVVFGAFLRTSGGGEFFIKFAYALFGHVRGGPPKVAVVASSLFGMISGSGVANVVGTGQFTIPLMKRCGYPSHFAGAVEATSSAGGQIMPPVLGGSAFIMMEILGVSYLFIIKSIVIIACLYYLAVFIMIDIQAQKLGLQGIPKKELPGVWSTLKEGWFFLVPPIILLFFLGVIRYSPTLSGLYATLSIVLISWIRKSTRMGVTKIVSAMQEACYTFRPIGTVLACAGLLVALVNMTGLALMLSDLLLQLSGGVLPILLFLTMISSIILGMGVPNTAAYLILSILVAPALIKMGVVPIAAHLFIFYFAVFSGITPPVAPEAFVAAGIAEAPVMKTALTACKIGLIGLILPYIMIYDQAFLLVGGFLKVFWATLTAIIGTIALGSAINGYLFRQINLFYRICLFSSAIALIIPGIITDSIGLGILLIVAWIHYPNFYIEIPRKYFLKYISALTLVITKRTVSNLYHRS